MQNSSFDDSSVWITAGVVSLSYAVQNEDIVPVFFFKPDRQLNLWKFKIQPPSKYGPLRVPVLIKSTSPSDKTNFFQYPVWMILDSSFPRPPQACGADRLCSNLWSMTPCHFPSRETRNAFLAWIKQNIESHHPFSLYIQNIQNILI